MPTDTAAPLRNDAKVLGLSALGGALEFYDFVVFVFFAKTLGMLFFPADIPGWLAQLQVFGIFAAGYLVRPIGGVVMAHFGDRIGRKRLFAFSVFLMALPTLCIGLLPTYAQVGVLAPLLLLFLRLLQGLAIGGEMPGAWVFVAEHAPPGKVGFAVASLSAGINVGTLMGALMASAMAHFFTPAELVGHAWRIPFLIGGVFGFISVWLRRWLDETPVFAQIRERRVLSRLPIKEVLRDYRGGVLVSMCVTWVLTAGIVVVILMTPTWLQKQFGIPAAAALQANCLATVALMFGCIISGSIVDRLGASKTFIFGSLFLGICSWSFYHMVAADASVLMGMYALAGLSVGVVGAVPYVMVRAFPAEVRFTGISFSYNMAYAIFGGLTPVFVTLIMRLTPMAPAYYVLALSVIGLLTGIYLSRDLNSETIRTEKFAEGATSGQ